MPKPTGTISLDQANPSHGDTVSFTISTENVEQPYVLLNVYDDDDVWIYAGQAPYWEDAVGDGAFTLATTNWTSGGGHAVALLGAIDVQGRRFREIASTEFEVTP